MDLFKQYGNDHVALIGTTLKGQTPIRCCVDKLGKGARENWIVLSSESEFGNEDHLFSNKRVASTIHKFKGLERKAILLCDMNDFIEGRATTPLDHFNLFYVACTRAKEKLVIQAPISKGRNEYATIRGKSVEFESKPRDKCNVTDLTSYVPFDALLSMRDQLFTSKELYHCKTGFEFESNDRLIDGRVSGTKEDMSAFIGMAVHAKIQLLLSGTLQHIPVDERKNDSDMYEWYETIFKTKPPNDITWSDLIRYAIVYETYLTQYKHYWRQITPNLKSIRVDMMDQCVINAITTLYKTVIGMGENKELSQQPVEFNDMINYLKPITKCEVPVHIPIPFPWFDQYSNILSGSADLIIQLDAKRRLVVELKVSNQMRIDHMLQTSLYTKMLQYMNVDHDIEYISVVLLCNRGISYYIDLLLKPTVDHEFIYRMALRKVGQNYDSSSLIN
jgi:hypothetical protein